MKSSAMVAALLVIAAPTLGLAQVPTGAFRGP